jgi:hypothetical protein
MPFKAPAFCRDQVKVDLALDRTEMIAAPNWLKQSLAMAARLGGECSVFSHGDTVTKIICRGKP